MSDISYDDQLNGLTALQKDRHTNRQCDTLSSRHSQKYRTNRECCWSPTLPGVPLKEPVVTGLPGNLKVVTTRLSLKRI